MEDKPSKWLVMEEDDCRHIVPETDILPHGFVVDGKGELAGENCPCKPRMDSDSEKLIIIHNSFEQQKKIDESMEKINH